MFLYLMEGVEKKKTNQLLDKHNLGRIGPFLEIPYVGVDEYAVHLRVHRLHHDLEAVEGACLWDLDLLAESLHLVARVNTRDSTALP